MWLKKTRSLLAPDARPPGLSRGKGASATKWAEKQISSEKRLENGTLCQTAFQFTRPVPGRGAGLFRFQLGQFQGSGLPLLTKRVKAFFCARQFPIDFHRPPSRLIGLGLFQLGS